MFVFVCLLVLPSHPNFSLVSFNSNITAWLVHQWPAHSHVRPGLVLLWPTLTPPLLLAGLDWGTQCMNLPAYCLHDPCIDSSLQITSSNLMTNFFCTGMGSGHEKSLPSVDYFPISWVTLSFLLLSMSSNLLPPLSPGGHGCLCFHESVTIMLRTSPEGAEYSSISCSTSFLCSIWGFWHRRPVLGKPQWHIFLVSFSVYMLLEERELKPLR